MTPTTQAARSLLDKFAEEGVSPSPDDLAAIEREAAAAERERIAAAIDAMKGAPGDTRLLHRWRVRAAILAEPSE